MLRSMIATASTVALCLASICPAPAAAQSNHVIDFDGPRGATAAVRLRVPFGPGAERRRPNLGLSLTYGRPIGAADATGRRRVRQLGLAEFRFDSNHAVRWRTLNAGGGGQDQSEEASEAQPEESGSSPEELLEWLQQIHEAEREQQRRDRQNRKKGLWFVLIGSLFALATGAVIFAGGGDSDDSEEDPGTIDPIPGE